MLDKIYQVQETDPSPILSQEISHFLAKIKEKKFPIEEIKEFTNNLPDFNKLRERDLIKLEKNGLVKREIFQGNQIYVVDIKKAKNTKFRDILKTHNGTELGRNISIIGSKYYGNGNSLSALNYIFKDGVVSQEDYQKALEEGEKPEPIPLIYKPGTLEDATDPEKIKKAKFYLGFWELARGSDIRNIDKFFDPMIRINPKEANFACLVFHPKFGNGHRDANGELKIFNNNSGTFQPLSFRYLSKEFTTGLSQEICHPIDFVKKHCQHLLERNIIKLEDINISQKHQTENYRCFAKISPSRSFVLDCVQYYIKRNLYLHNNALAAKINDNLGCVFDTNTNKILYIFPLQKLDELKSNPSKYSSSYGGESGRGAKVYILGEKLSKVESFDEKNFINKKDDETLEQYKERINSYNYLKLELDLTKTAKDLDVQFSFRQISPEIVAIIKSDPEKIKFLGVENIINFHKEFGLKAMEILFLIEAVCNGGKTFIELSTKLVPQENFKVFIDTLNQKILTPLTKIIKVIANLEKKEVNSIIHKLKEQNNFVGALDHFLDYSLDESRKKQTVNIGGIDKSIKSNFENSGIDAIYGYMIDEFSNQFEIEKIRIDDMNQFKNNQQLKQIFLEYVSKLNNDEIKNVQSFIGKFGEIGFSVFQSLEYSGHFIGNIIETCQKLPSKEANKILLAYNNINRLSQEFTSDLHDLGVNNILCQQLYHAILRRVTEMTTVAHKVTLNGKAETRFYRDEAISCNNIKEVITAFDQYKQQLEVVKDFFLFDGKNYKFEYIGIDESIGSDPQTYHFKVTDLTSNQLSHFMMQTRSNGVKNELRNKDKEFDGEARINFLFIQSPKDPNYVSESISDEERKNASSFRIDREGKIRKGDIIIKNDPSIKQGEISLEVSSINETLGKILALGNALTLEDQGLKEVVNPQFYHNRDSFSKNFGLDVNFSKLVEGFRNYIKFHYKIK